MCCCSWACAESAKPATIDISGNAVFVWEAPGGSTFRYLTNAGGGWGDPLARAPERVMRDVRDGYVTIDGAARDYGVVVLGDPDEFPEELTVDEQATAELRASR